MTFLDISRSPLLWPEFWSSVSDFFAFNIVDTRCMPVFLHMWIIVKSRLINWYKRVFCVYFFIISRQSHFLSNICCWIIKQYVEFFSTPETSLLFLQVGPVFEFVICMAIKKALFHYFFCNTWRQFVEYIKIRQTSIWQCHAKLFIHSAVNLRGNQRSEPVHFHIKPLFRSRNIKQTLEASDQTGWAKQHEPALFVGRLIYQLRLVYEIVINFLYISINRWSQWNNRTPCLDPYTFFTNLFTS